MCDDLISVKRQDKYSPMSATKVSICKRLNITEYGVSELVITDFLLTRVKFNPSMDIYLNRFFIIYEIK